MAGRFHISSSWQFTHTIPSNPLRARARTHTHTPPKNLTSHATSAKPPKAKLNFTCLTNSGYIAKLNCSLFTHTHTKRKSYTVHFNITLVTAAGGVISVMV